MLLAPKSLHGSCPFNIKVDPRQHSIISVKFHKFTINLSFVLKSLTLTQVIYHTLALSKFVSDIYVFSINLTKSGSFKAKLKL